MDDRKPPTIIKSGARHSVQVAQGTLNAKSVRNVVTSDADAPIEDRFVNPQEAAGRQAAALRSGPEEERQAGAANVSLAPGAGVPPAPGHGVVDAQAPAAAANWAQAPEAGPAGAAHAGPIVPIQVRADQDATIAKQQPVQTQDVFVQEPQAAHDPRNAFVGDAATPDNLQRIENIQAQAQRIRLDQAAPSSDNRVPINAAPVQRASHELPKAAPPLSAAAARDALAARQPHASAAAQADLPPEVAANMGQTAAALQAKESDLMARLRAIKSNMSVTENRLTQLNPTDPPKT